MHGVFHARENHKSFQLDNPICVETSGNYGNHFPKWFLTHRRKDCFMMSFHLNVKRDCQ